MGIIKIGIASNNIDKINGIRWGFLRFFNKAPEVEVFHQAVKSGVPEQPFDEEIYLGAKNRVTTLLSSYDTMDYYVGCEAGIESIFGVSYNVQVICIYDSKKRIYSYGKSAGWEVPFKDIEVIKKSNLDDYLRSKGFDVIEKLLGAEYSRANAVAQATEFALATLTRL